MKLFCVLCLICSLTVFAESKGRLQDRGYKYHQPSVFEVIPLNSPVKGQIAKFRLKLPVGFEVAMVKAKLVNANDFKKDQKDFREINPVNNELHLSVSNLPPGFYRLYVTVKDKKTQKEQSFQTKHHDFVRFAIDESLQVPMPDPKKNNSTVAGVDSDSDGIRDDVQRWINETYSSQQKLKMAMRQYAIAYQLNLLTVDNKELSIHTTFKTFEADDCLEGLMGLDHGIDARDKLIFKFLNTKDRLIAEKKADLNFHGQGGRILKEKLPFCQFEAK